MAEHAPYDPKKAHEYYERTKHLIGRSGTASKSTPTSVEVQKAALARVNRLKAKVSTLVTALSAAQAAFSVARQKEHKTARENSDGKSTAAQKQASQQYRDKNEAKLSSQAKKTSSSGGSSSSPPASKSLSTMSSAELGTRISKIQSALKEARSQLSSATQQLGQLTHSAITSDPNVNEHFAQFRSERIPSK